MSTLVPNSPQRDSSSFRIVVDAFLSGDGLPFADILSAERTERIFAKYGCQFGQHGVYTAAITVWSFLSQVLRDGKEASCQAAVARVVSHCQQQRLDPPTEETGDYCRARAKLSEAALHELSCEVAEELEEAADPSWLWKVKHHPKLIDGFTFTMPYKGKQTGESALLRSISPSLRATLPSSPSLRALVSTHLSSSSLQGRALARERF